MSKITEIEMVASPLEEGRVFWLQKMLKLFQQRAKETAPILDRLRQQMNVGPSNVLSTDDSPFKIEQYARGLWLLSVTDQTQSYANYRNSPLWKIIRNNVVSRDKCECKSCLWHPRAGRKRVCDRYLFEVHHRSYTYEVMAGLDDSQLITLCRPCHNYIHFYASGERKGQKRPQAEWDMALKALQERFAQKRKKERARTRCFNQLKNLIEKEQRETLSPNEKTNKQKLKENLNSYWAKK